MLILLVFITLIIQIIEALNTTNSTFIQVKIGLRKEYSVKSGDRIRLDCEFDGQVDNIYWIKNLEEILEPKRGRIQILRRNSSTSLIIKRIDIFDKGSYSCYADNKNAQNASSETILNVVDVDLEQQQRFRKPFSGDDDFLSEFLTHDDIPPTLNPTIIESNDPSESIRGYCEPYRGSICSSVFYGTNNSIYSINDKQQIEIENKLKHIMPLIQTIPQSKPQCSQFILSSLCLFAFPLCDSSSSSSFDVHLISRPKQICRSDCVKLQYDICLNEYLSIKSLFSTHNTKDNLMLECNQLPPSSDIQSQCVPVIKMTVDRLNPKINTENSEQSIIKSFNITDKKLISLLYILVPSISIIILVLCLFLTVCYCRKVNKTDATSSSSSSTTSSCQRACSNGIQTSNKHRMSNSNVGLKHKQSTKYLTNKTTSSKSSVSNCSGPFNNLETNPFIQKAHIESVNQQDFQLIVRQFNPQSIRFLQEIGRGRFGKAFLGEVVIGQVNQVTKCYIKTLNEREFNNSNVEQEFYNEINLYSTLKHKNLSNLIGIYTQMDDDFPRCLIMECMSQGDLHEYLVQRGQALGNLSLNSGTIGQTSQNRSIMEFIYIAQQIAQGMEYLAHHNFVHKDLATRNILMGDNLSVKISDIAQFKECYAKDYYKFQNRVLPVRWMSPESLLFGRYAQDTDIYSFGVLLWEIFNYGVTPYSGCTNPEVVQMIRDRQLLMIPDECPPKVYQLMLDCWHEHSVQRPTFTDLVNSLKNWENYYSINNQQQQPLTIPQMVNSVSNQTASTGFSSSSPIVPTTCCSPGKLNCHPNAAKFKRPPSPPSSCITTASSTRIYREIESTNSLRGSIRPTNFVPNI